MTPLMLLGIMVVVPIVVLVLLRVNAAIVFLSLCLGSVLVQFAGSDAHSLAKLFTGSKAMNGYGVSLVLLLLPAVVTTIVMVGTVRGKVRLLLNMLPALSAGLLAVVLAEPLVSPGLRGSLAKSSIWHYTQRADVLIIGFGAIFSLLFLWMQRPKHAGGESGKHHHH